MKRFNLQELIDKEYSMELSIKDKDGNVVGTNNLSNISMRSFDNDFNTYTSMGEGEYAGEIMMLMFEQMMTSHDVLRFKKLDRIAFKNDGGNGKGMQTVFEWSYERNDEAREDMTQNDWNQTLYNEIDRAVFAIGIESNKEIDAPICVVVSPEVLAIFDDYENFLISPNPYVNTSWARTQLQGKLVSDQAEDYDDEVGIAVYKNPYIPAGKILVCYESDLNSSSQPSFDCKAATISVINLPTLKLS